MRRIEAMLAAELLGNGVRRKVLREPKLELSLQESDAKRLRAGPRAVVVIALGRRALRFDPAVRCAGVPREQQQRCKHAPPHQDRHERYKI